MQGIYNKDLAPLICAKDPNDWIRFFSIIFKNKNQILDLKKKDEIYIQEMNNYIFSQYKIFINNITS